MNQIDEFYLRAVGSGIAVLTESEIRWIFFMGGDVTAARPCL